MRYSLFYRFRDTTPFSDAENRNRFTHSKPCADRKVAVTLTATTFSTRSFLSGVLALQSLNLRFKLLVLFRQRIAGSCHCLEIVSDLAVLFLKFRHLGLQLLVLLQSFCVFAGSQRQTQNDRHTKCRPNVFACHT